MQIDEIKNIAKQLTGILPVGSSNNNFQPTVSIYRATYFLKYNSDLYLEGENDEIQDEIAHANNWNTTSFYALFAIMKQIRDNLFHGRKIDLNGVQYQRNKELIIIGAKLTDILLLNLKEAEENISSKLCIIIPTYFVFLNSNIDKCQKPFYKPILITSL